MKKALSAAYVERMKPPAEGQTEIFDRGYPGLSLRVSYGGKKSWSALFRLHGKLHRLSLGTYPAVSLAEARETWRETRKQVALEIDPSQAKGAARLSTGFSEVALEWLQRDQSKNKSIETVTRIVNRELLPAWGVRPMAEITRREIRDLIDKIVDRGKVIMARRVHSHLHRLFTWAVGRDIITVNPMTGLPKPGEETSRDRVLGDSELVQVWNAAENIGYPFGPAHQLLILTGCRREEIGRLKWSEIDGDIINLKGDRTKNAEPHLISLSTPARVILESLPHIAGSEFVFTTDGRKHVTSWSAAKEKLDAIVKIEPWVVHDLRRSCATGMQRMGVGLQVVESVLGHTAGSRAGVVKIYQRHSYRDEKRSALEAWGAHVMRLIKGTESAVVVPMRMRAS